MLCTSQEHQQRNEQTFQAVAKVPEIPEGRERAVYCKDTITKAMEELRTPVDELEMLVDKECGRCLPTAI